MNDLLGAAPLRATAAPDAQALLLPAPPPPTAAPGARALLRAVRPVQWVKNLLVLAAPSAAGVVAEPQVLTRCLLAVLSFTAVASSCYLLNDVQDRHLDRAHPRKRLRPVASGALSVRAALLSSAVLMVVGLALAVSGPRALPVVIGSYATLTLLYSVGLKAVPWLEITLVATGFVLRAVAGAAAAPVPVSAWFLLVVSAAAVVVVVSKRASERLRATGGGVAAIRPVLQSYTDQGLRRVRISAAVVLVAAYLGWAFARPAGAPALFAVLSVAPVLVVVARWTQQTSRGSTGAPENVLLHDRVIRGAVLAWVALFGAGVVAATLAS